MSYVNKAKHDVALKHFKRSLYSEPCKASKMELFAKIVNS